MRILSKSALKEFWQKYADAEQGLRYWYDITIKANWNSFAEVKMDFHSADLAGDCVVFNIKGNHYRLLVKINYEWKMVYIRFVMTHKEYDKGGYRSDCNC